MNESLFKLVLMLMYLAYENFVSHNDFKIGFRRLKSRLLCLLSNYFSEFKIEHFWMSDKYSKPNERKLHGIANFNSKLQIRYMNFHCNRNSDTFLGIFEQLMCPILPVMFLEFISYLAVKFKNITCEIQKLPSKKPETILKN